MRGLSKVRVITGGGSGMGLATAKVMGRDAKVILVGRTKSKLQQAAVRLRDDGIEALTFPCDISDEGSARKLASFARETGKVTSVINAAGLSPHAGDARVIMETKAIGTININDAFFPFMERGSCIVDVASMAAYIAPRLIIPKRDYPLCRRDRTRFMKRMMARVGLFPRKFRSSVAYVISKDFVIWFAKTDAARFGERGVRVVSVSPGNFETPMGRLENESASKYVSYCAIKRLGKVDEIAHLFAACVDKRMGYLTGVDILCDGGCAASGYSPLRMRKP